MVWPIVVRVGGALVIKGGAWVAKRLAKKAARKAAKKQASQAAKKAGKKFSKNKKAACQNCKKSACKVLAANIYRKGTITADRVADLIKDKMNQFEIARHAPAPSLPKGSGSYEGHIKAAKASQKGMRNDIQAYDKAGCKSPKIPKALRDLAWAKIPQAPIR